MPRKLWLALKGDFWGTLGRWQSRRPLWLIGGLAALSLELFSVLFFQKFLKLYPCELCVLIRFSMLTIFIGAMIAALNPRQPLLKAVGYLIVVWAIVRGIIWDIRLEIEVLKPAGEHPVCSMAPPSFPFGLPLDTWFPAHFTPMALCGDDGNMWFFLGLNMSEWLFFVYGIFAIGVALMLTSCLRQKFKCA